MTAELNGDVLGDRPPDSLPARGHGWISVWVTALATALIG